MHVYKKINTEQDPSDPSPAFSVDLASVYKKTMAAKALASGSWVPSVTIKFGAGFAPLF